MLYIYLDIDDDMVEPDLPLDLTVRVALCSSVD